MIPQNGVGNGSFRSVVGYIYRGICNYIISTKHVETIVVSLSVPPGIQVSDVNTTVSRTPQKNMYSVVIPLVLSPMLLSTFNTGE